MSEHRICPPCAPCLREGGWRPMVAERLSGSLNPPRASNAPFTGYQDGWMLEPMCAAHAKIAIEGEWAIQHAEQDTRHREEALKRQGRPKIAPPPRPDALDEATARKPAPTPQIGDLVPGVLDEFGPDSVPF